MAWSRQCLLPVRVRDLSRAWARACPSRRVLPVWLAGDSTITALIAYRQGLLRSVRVFIDHLAAEFPESGPDLVALVTSERHRGPRGAQRRQRFGSKHRERAGGVHH